MTVALVALPIAPPPAAAQGAGTLEVEVRYAGAPVVETVRVTRDVAVCGTEARIEKVAVGPGRGLANAVVSLAGLKVTAAPGKATIEQKGCAFQPRVVTMTPGELELVNADGILHTLRTYSTANAPLNRAQPKFRKTMTVTLEKPEIVRIACDVHPWMTAWVAVMPDPYAAVTDASGTARLDGVPAGKQTVEVWHEVLGRQSRTVEVKPGQTTKVVVDMRGR